MEDWANGVKDDIWDHPWTEIWVAICLILRTSYITWARSIFLNEYTDYWARLPRYCSLQTRNIKKDRRMRHQILLWCQTVVTAVLKSMGDKWRNTLKTSISTPSDFWWRNTSRKLKNTLQRGDLVMQWLLLFSLSSLFPNRKSPFFFFKDLHRGPNQALVNILSFCLKSILQNTIYCTFW